MGINSVENASDISQKKHFKFTTEGKNAY
jgi:hypothetical protein